MSITVIIEADVKNFENWLALFNELEDQRQEAGINFKAFKNASETQTSFVIGTAPSKQVFFDFFNTPKRLAIQQAIIVNPPIITFLESV
jgi:hypothetical protein